MRPKKIAFIGTVMHPLAHSQHILDRFTLGYSWGGAWVLPRVKIAGLYIDQFPEDDLAHARAKKHHLRFSPTIADALTLGTGRLAVDGVVIVAEHGKYPKNAAGQTLYPRYRWFKEVIRVFEAAGRSVPVFTDKHLSTAWPECVEMVEDSRRLGFALMAGSSLPVTRRMPALEMPYNADLTESVCVAYGGVDSYDFHAFETAQCMSERRRGEEAGVQTIQALRDEAVWKRLAAPKSAVTRSLVVAALNRSHNLPVTDRYVTDAVTFDWARKAFPQITGFFMEHVDGFRTCAFLAKIRDFNYAGKLKGEKRPLACQFYLPMPDHGSTTADFFNPLCRHIEEMILTGKPPYPIERTLLTSGMVIAGVDSLANGQRKIATPHLARVAYRAAPRSVFWRD
jgi:hypothetical protein